jgi:hypothetical protein
LWHVAAACLQCKALLHYLLRKQALSLVNALLSPGASKAEVYLNIDLHVKQQAHSNEQRAENSNHEEIGMLLHAYTYSSALHLPVLMRYLIVDLLAATLQYLVVIVKTIARCSS